MPDNRRQTSARVERLFRFWSRFYDHPLPQTLFYRRIHQLLMAEISPLKPTSVLDAGCGTGELLRKLSRRFPTTQLIGLDLSYEMLAKAHAKSYPADTPVELIQGSVYQLPFADNSLGLITNTISSHFYLDFDTALAEFHRVLRPGGTLAMASMGNGVFRLFPGPWRDQISIPDADYRSPGKQTAQLQQVGFDVQQRLPLPVFSWLYICRKPIGP